MLGERVEFNEILSVMYREGQKMSWHDDGEAGTLSPPTNPLSTSVVWWWHLVCNKDHLRRSDTHS